MQLSLALAPEALPPVGAAHKRLLSAFGSFSTGPRMAPVDQLVKSLISSRTYDDVSWPAHLRLKARYRPWERLIEAPAAEIQAVIAPVTHADIKAGWLPEALGRIVRAKGSLSLEFLADLSVEEAMAWLRRLPGVGDKVAAAVLNFSTLRRPVMVVDTHVWRVARRIGLAGRNADPEGVRRAIMDAVPAGWKADDYFDLHWLLKRLGQTLCEHNHTRCGACPVAPLCQERQRALAVIAKRGEGAALAFRQPGNKS
ncbi:MAG TPA: endonuclease III [Caulobacteraceae bacterium]|jgi:endonuclease-3|nr:endonuclease III [Caulobacteraceae bacterium]